MTAQFPVATKPAGFPKVLPSKALEQRLQTAVLAVLPDADVSTVLVRPCQDTKFGDYQTSALMALAKARKLNPRQLATDVLAKLEVSDLCAKTDIAGAGFINFFLKPEVLQDTLLGAVQGQHLFFAKAEKPKTVVIDFSSPNVAKPMHVGHIRSTILGDSLARAFRLLGHKVVTDNHIGDWGTQFGMLLLGWKTMLDKAALAADPIAELERIYRAVNAKCDPAKPTFDQPTLDAARAELVKLQAGDAENLAIWRKMIELSQLQFDTVYGRLGVKFDHVLGESFYNPFLKSVVEDLRSKSIAKESNGAICVFSDGLLPPKEDPLLIHTDEGWNPNPCLIQKSDGAANYATTDLATLQYRIKTWAPERIIYVTDDRQQLHFKQVFNVFGRWQPEVKVSLEHVFFGTITDENKQPLKTRDGGTVKLVNLMDEAEERALKIVNEKHPEYDEATAREIARVVGIGAVKYQDLLPNRQSNYIFSWDKMLAVQGNSAPYLMIAYTRIRSIFRKAEEQGKSIAAGATIVLKEPDELALAKQLLNFGFVLEALVEECRPNYMCNYLYDLAGFYAKFYEACPVLKAEEPERSSRLLLCEVTAKVLKQGLEVLGIETTEKM